MISTSDIKAFASLFAGLPYAYVQTRLTGGQKGYKKEISAQTIREDVTETVYKNHLEYNAIGLCPILQDGESVVFGAIDLDRNLNFKYEAILRDIHKYQLPLTLVASKSGGCHLYLFSCRVPSSTMRASLLHLASLLGLASNEKGEAVEVFPKQVRLLPDRQDLGAALTLPYGGDREGYAYILENEAQRALTLSEFLQIAEASRLTEKELKELSSKGNSDEFKDAPPCIENLLKHGVPEGGRNTTLFHLGVYLKISRPDDWERVLDALNTRFFNPACPLSEVRETINSLKKKKYQYLCKQSPICSYCDKQECITRTYGVGNEGGTALSVVSIQKLDSNPPTFVLHILNKDLQPTPLSVTLEQLVSAPLMKKACVSSLDFLPLIPSQKAWEVTVRKLLEDLTVVELPEDSSIEGQLLLWLQRFVQKKGRVGEKEELLVGKPVIIGEDAYFRLFDFANFLELNGFKSLKPHEIAAIFQKEVSSKKMEQKAFKIKGKFIKTWKTAYQKEEKRVLPFEVLSYGSF
jgi:hypothetical protein